MVKALKEVVDVERIGDRIIVDKVVLGEVTMNIVLTYALQVGLVKEIKAKFQEDFEGLIQGIHRQDKIIIGDDLNGHMGREGNGGTDIEMYMEAMDLGI